MYKLTSVIAAGVFLASGAVAQSPQWGQCGGIGWSGATTCVSGSVCSKLNDYYSQCIPGSAPPAPSTTPGGTTQPGGGGTPTSTATGGSATLAPGYSFIRAVVDPNFHKYLRAEVKNTASDAVLGDPGDAAQFQVTSGQLVQNAGGTNLYAIVESPADSTVKKLKVSWSATPATSGTFVFSGDTLEWSNPSITRPQNNAWLVCPDAAGNRDLYVNLGPYSYMTPAGCADQTIHAYTGSTATA
ncbi:hypothetical protein HGRIS_012319 [Hohenbuehelia grisea]|uniref:CBM1 domain-containing protein n=1 Tax=Hohenbuehelia grisea TaxID=104357 RepID=A0ABR3IS30_9AGAR